MIIGVAIKNENITIMLPKPSRHVDCFRHAESLGIDVMRAGIGIKAKDQGFYTHTGKYLNREQAYRYARRIKQPFIDGPVRHCICSEDLW